MRGSRRMARCLSGRPPRPALEEEMLALGSEGGPSPDRADALVWAITRLMLGPQKPGQQNQCEQ